MKHGKAAAHSTTSIPARPHLRDRRSAGAVRPVSAAYDGWPVVPVCGPQAGGDRAEAVWRLPSGIELAEFALRGGGVAPGLMRRPPMSVIPAMEEAPSRSGSRTQREPGRESRKELL